MKHAWILLMSFVALGATGCGARDIDNAQKSAEKAISTAAPVLGDAALTAQIESRFVGIDSDSALHVAIETHDGDVKLSGRVKSAAIEERFGAAAKGVAGVKNVDMHVVVDPKLPSVRTQAGDVALATSVAAQIVGQAGLNGFNVRPVARNGVVTLTGRVKSETIKTTILETAKHAAGVKRIVDRIVVAP
ncbi:MAG TPA: BON domain-containing protein [Candidatus Baltobacteraceae bacterium]|nr:BON domain-containing protein [Candidatus Baltobacteraceae bacterium]